MSSSLAQKYHSATPSSSMAWKASPTTKSHLAVDFLKPVVMISLTTCYFLICTDCLQNTTNPDNISHRAVSMALYFVQFVHFCQMWFSWPFGLDIAIEVVVDRLHADQLLLEQRWKKAIKIAQMQKRPKNISTKKIATKQRKWPIKLWKICK